MLRGIPAREMSYLAPSQSVPMEETRGALEKKASRNSTEISTEPPVAKDETESLATSPQRRTPGHQRLVFSDPVAFRYLEDDPATIVLDRRRRLAGYESYIVEQWACSRVHPTFIICAYTGDMSHSILVSVLGVPSDESTWSPRLRTYFQAVSQSHSRKRETPLGTLMVTNLSSFPSALTVIAIPEGDIKKHREDFFVNENLKRMGCTGRAGLNLQYPQASTIAKFHHVYRVSESIPLYPAVIELVRLCQTALIIFGKLQLAYADGLLCDVTEKAINEWWADIGTFFHNVEPSDGVLGPTTVAALLGLMIGAYNRLKAAGAPVGKDVLDMASMKRAISTFQRANKLHGSRRLDRQTLNKLHRSTAKSASGEGWTAAKAVKSTVAELSGKGGEMVMGIVGGREKASIAEVETLDLDQFAQLVSSNKMKWLWQGKHLKSPVTDYFGSTSDELNGQVFSTDDQGNFMWTGGKRDSLVMNNFAGHSAATAGEQHVVSRLDPRRAKDATPSSKLHHPEQLKDKLEPKAPGGRMSGIHHRPQEHKETTAQGLRQFRTGESFATDHSPNVEADGERLSARTRPMTGSNYRFFDDWTGQPVTRRSAEPPKFRPQPELAELRQELQSGVYQDFTADFQYEGPQAMNLRRSRSAIQLRRLQFGFARSDRLPRNLSFSVVEDAALRYHRVAEDDAEDSEGTNTQQSSVAALHELTLVKSQMDTKKVMMLQQVLALYAQNQVSNVEGLDGEAASSLEELNNHYYQRLDEYQTLRATSTDVVSDEKTGLTESLRRLEMLGAKLDYELTALQSRTQEVEDGVGDFERSVLDIEGKVKDLTDDHKSRPSNNWFVEVINFFGRATSSRRPSRGNVSLGG